MDHSLPGCSIHGILQTIVLEWVAMPPPGDLPDSGIELVSLMSPALAGGFFATSATWGAPYNLTTTKKQQNLKMDLGVFNRH